MHDKSARRVSHNQRRSRQMTARTISDSVAPVTRKRDVESYLAYPSSRECASVFLHVIPSFTFGLSSTHRDLATDAKLLATGNATMSDEKPQISRKAR